jgi:hypothetical protein
MTEIPPDYAERLAKEIADIYGDATASLLRTVAKRLARGVDEPGWAEAKLLELVQLRADAAEVVAALTEQMPATVERIVTEAAEAGLRQAVRDLELTASPAASTNTAAVDALARQTIGDLSRTHLQVLRSAEDIYRSVITETTSGTVTGAETRRQSAQRALDRFARRGITGFRDTAGRNWSLETYAEMSTRTASGRAMVQGSLDTYAAAGRDLVIVSDAPEECKTCRPFEGKLLSISGAKVGERVGGIPVVDTVRGATSRGLFHANCRHRVSPYIEGLTKPMRDTADPEGDELRRRQRALERRIRAAKSQVAAAEPFGPGPELARVKGALARAQADMREFISEHDRKRLRYREQLGAR